MDEKASSIENLYEHIEAYSKTSLELYKLKAIDKTAEVASNLASSLIVITITSFFILFVNIGIAIWLGELLNKMYYGFFIVSAFYAIAALIIYQGRNKWIKMPISNSIITQYLK
ncbi:MAG TPA: hypothetical protein VK590_06770 [Saprospiraceae bacterium]|nr:hypothetical protein [Saprospiraceae bacterium]